VTRPQTQVEKLNKLKLTLDKKDRHDPLPGKPMGVLSPTQKECCVVKISCCWFLVLNFILRWKEKPF